VYKSPLIPFTSLFIIWFLKSYMYFWFSPLYTMLFSSNGIDSLSTSGSFVIPWATWSCIYVLLLLILISWLIAGFVARVTRCVSLVEQKLPALPEHLSSPTVFSGVHVAGSLVFWVMLCWSLIALLSIFFKGPSSWSYGSWIYNYLCNHCLSPLTLWVWIPLRQGVLDTTLRDKSLSVTYDRSVVFSWYSGFLHQ
jgi:hypothetical protein